jgi:uncharacterized protein with PIN domain
MPETLRFCADVHLGKLSRLLIMLGFDTVYENDFSKEDLYEIALKDQRVLLSKSDYFSRLPGIDFYRINSADPFEQLKDLIQHFNLRHLFQPFSRCLYCNEILQKTKKEEVENQLLPNTKKDFSEFWKCPSCQRIYWKGSHYERMMKTVLDLESRL